MVSDVADRIDFTIQPLTTERVHVELALDEGVRPAKVKASLTYIWFAPPPAEAQDRMQKDIIRRIESSAAPIRDQILNEDIPALMAAKNTMESAYPPVLMATAESKVQ